MQGQEIELKAGLSTDEARAILRTLRAAYGPAMPTAHLRSLYFDTPVQGLKACGLALRVRREGGRFIQTVKAGRTGIGGYQQVRELESPVSGFKPRISSIADRSVREAVETATRATILVPQFETNVRRTKWLVSEPHGEIEIALDRGWLEADTRKAPILELELELKGGSPEALFDLAEKLLAGTNACLSLASKSARGYALAAGSYSCASPLASKPGATTDGMTAGEVLQDVLSSLAETIAANLHATMVSDDPEGPHQLRVALRRLRSALRLFSGVLDRKLATDLNLAAREIGRSVSALRDADVLTEIIVGAGNPQADAYLRSELEAHRSALRVEARRALGALEATRFALRLQRLAAIEAWRHKANHLAETLENVSQKPLADRWARIVALGDRLSMLTVDERHELRKRLKEYRYMTENISVNKDVNHKLKIIKKLQTALGTLNDLHVMANWNPDLGTFDAEERFAEIRASLLTTGRYLGDVSLGRACRHWSALRLLADQ